MLGRSLCRFRGDGPGIRTGILGKGDQVIDLGDATLFDTILQDPISRGAAMEGGPVHPLERVALLAPVGEQPVWAAGVTYQRSRTARMEESDFSATAYHRVHRAPRPELFFKAMPGDVVGPGEEIGIRRDSEWNVPEPELALLFGADGTLVGCTIGNDVSSRDIEGENLLYLPQAKVYARSCALGPWVVLGVDEAEMRQWEIRMEIHRDGRQVFSGTTSVDRIVRSFGELGEYLFRSQIFPHGVFLLTGTGIVPDDGFTLKEGDRVVIGITGIGHLENPVRQV